MSILSSANSGKYSIPLSEDILLKNNFYCALGNDIKPYLAHHTFVKYGSGIYGIDTHPKRYRHSVYDALYIDTKQEGTDEQGNPKIVGYIGISTPIDLIDNGIWKFEITKQMMPEDLYWGLFVKATCGIDANGNVIEFDTWESYSRCYFHRIADLRNFMKSRFLL